MDTDSRPARTGVLLLSLLFLPVAGLADAGGVEIADLSLEELARIPVTSVSRRAEPLAEAPASIYVITAEAIRRSGVGSLAEALRLAPNLQVARLDATQYAISARGFNNAIGNKLLVLIDGRTVYSPFFSGVFWDEQDVMLADVDQIEVISGPGATLWGANAVNGVINITTRASSQTQGLLLAGTAGDAERGAEVRYGMPLGAAGHLRLYARTNRLRHTESATGRALPDSNQRQQFGFRADWSAGADSFTAQGDARRAHAEHRGFFGPYELTPIESSNVNLLARWVRRLDDGSQLRVQAYVDHSEREDALVYRPHVNVGDLEFQHDVTLGAHQLVWGGGVRRARDHIEPGVFFGFDPVRRSKGWSNAFVQDEWPLAANLDLTLGLKLERNDDTGTEVLPNLRLAWKPGGGGLAWGALSRAVRAPARLDRDVRLPPAGPPFIIAGGQDFVSEIANVLELGYRAQVSTTWSYSVTAFVHDWSRLRSGQPSPNAHVQNMIDGQTRGLEGWASWQALPNWRLSAGLSTLKKDLRLRPESTDPVGPANLGNDPSHQWSLRSAWDPAEGRHLELAVRRVAALPEPAVPAYTAFDATYVWRVSDSFELALEGRNLFDPGHIEFDGGLLGRNQVGRSVALRVKWTP